MKFTDCHSSVAFFMYCSAAVLVIVNGQPTIDGDIDKDQNSILIDIVAELRAEQSRSAAEFRAQIGKLENKVAELEGQLAATSTNATKQDAEFSAQVGKLENKIAKLERQLAATSTPKPDASKWNRMTLHLPRCVTFVAMFDIRIVFPKVVNVYQISR